MNITKQVVATRVGDITVVTMVNKSGAMVKLSSLGAGVLSIVVPDSQGNMADVVLGYDDLADYMCDGPCAGKTAGRYANRIARGHLEVDGKLYQLAVNCGPNHLHGGPMGFQNHIWDVAIVDDTVVFSRISPDGEENYPGNLAVKVAYRWDDDNSLLINYVANTDAPTVVNLTNHTYFNLNGHASGSALGHLLQLNCSRYLATDQSLTPLGELPSVESTPMDFTKAKPLGRDIEADFTPLKYGKGYDHCWAVDGYVDGEICNVATLVDPDSGRRLDVMSTQPSAQVYTGNWLTGSPKGKGGVEYHDYDCVAIECQGMPDAPNHSEFPSQELRPGQTYRHSIVYQFSVNTH
jgi:aldose 1-epimerase